MKYKYHNAHLGHKRDTASRLCRLSVNDIKCGWRGHECVRAIKEKMKKYADGMSGVCLVNHRHSQIIEITHKEVDQFGAPRWWVLSQVQSEVAI